MTLKQKFKSEIEMLDIPKHLKELIIVTGDLYAAESWQEGFTKAQEITQKTLSIFNQKKL